jgi:hypothetical protein
LASVAPVRISNKSTPIAFVFHQQIENNLSQVVTEMVRISGFAKRNAGPEFLDGSLIPERQMLFLQFMVQNRPCPGGDSMLK